MFLHIVRFELRYYLRRISTWMYFGIFFALGFLLINAAGGAFSAISVSTGGKEHVNSPLALAASVGALSIFGVIVTAALVGNAVYRDYEAGIHPLFFTTPVRKRDYLLGRFAGATLINVLVFAAIPLGLMIGGAMPYLERGRFGPFRLAAYAAPLFTLTLPNLLLTGAIFFALAALTRQMLSNYIGGVVLLVGYLLAGQLLQDIENKTLAGMLDPFGIYALELDTRYWSVVQKNAWLIPLEGLLLWNRLVWLGVAALVFGVFYLRFRFAHQASERAKKVTSEPRPAPAPASRVLPDVARAFGGRAQLVQWRSMARREFWGIVRNRYFAAIVAAGLAFLVFSATQVGKIYGTTTYPVTYEVLELLGGTFGLFLLIIITFYAGELVWRERELRVDGITDSMPRPTWTGFLAKLAALVGVVIVLLGVLLVAGVLVQAFKGFYRFELPLYIQTLFGTQLVNYLLLCVLALAIHTLVNHKYAGHLAVVLFYVGQSFLPQIGVEHNLLRFNSSGGLRYSDMNGYGHYLGPWLWWKGYWAAFAVLLAVATLLFWVRGRDTAWRKRIALAQARFGPVPRAVAAIAGIAFVGIGAWIFYNTNVLNDFRTSKEIEAARAEYEKRFKRFDGIPQPRITSSVLHADLFPERREARLRGRLGLRNKTGAAIDSVHVRLPREAEIASLGFDRPSRRVLEDEDLGYRIFALAQPLAPGDSLTLAYDVAYRSRGFANETENNGVLENGTFINSSYVPGIGYSAQMELAEDSQRKKYGLQPKPRMADVHDRQARMDTYLGQDADWIRFEATVSTSPDQIALAPGYLQREWTQGGRRFFHYEMDAPILNFYSLLSARYAVKRDRWRDVDIQVFYHPGHEWNLDRMIASTRASLEYFSKNFGPYQHRQLRIVEFPRLHGMFAQSFPNTVPFSEAIGFIAKVDPETDIDYPYYVTSHEVAHQWWAHQVIGGNVQGATMLSETMSQYGALMVMKHTFGADQMRRFLKYELDRYLLGRSMEQKTELPLYRVENQQYIHYNKGSVVGYALQDLLGEERLNQAIARFVRAVRFQEPPYTHTPEWLAYVRAATPDSLRYALVDLFRTITLYDNRARSATATPLGGNRYAVDLEIEAGKLRADSLGNEARTPMNDWVDVGVLAAPRPGEETGRPIYLAKHRIRSGRQRVRVVVNERPARAGIDPLNKLVDRITDDNTVPVEVRASRSP